jgi:hypothetical protein
MKVKGLDGRTYNLDLTGRVPLESEQGGSLPHARCRALLERLFPADRRLEEVALPGSGHLRLDFLLPGRRLAIEVHGEQHYRFVPHFHKTRLGFIQHLKRDTLKVDWCILNRLTHVELRHDGTDADWTARLRAADSPDRGEASRGG